MASAKELKKRISTVTNTQQTTKAMKMVSAAKLRRAQNAILANRPYALEIDSMMKRLASMGKLSERSKLIMSAGAAPESGDSGLEKKKVLLVLVTSDRGLCGGFNAQVQKTGFRWIEANRDRVAIQLAFIGRKGHDFFKNRGFKASKYQEFGRKAEFSQAKAFSSWLVTEFLKGSFQEVKIVYNEFKNAISQNVVVEDFLPIPTVLSETESAQKSQDDVSSVQNDLVLVKPSREALFDALLDKQFAIQVHRILLESQASEHGARMSAMENATQNAGDMIHRLTLAYNKQRQAGITGELLEIIAGSESQNQS